MNSSTQFLFPRPKIDFTHLFRHNGCMAKLAQSLHVLQATKPDEYHLKFDVDQHIDRAHLSNILNRHFPLHLVYQSHYNLKKKRTHMNY